MAIHLRDVEEDRLRVYVYGAGYVTNERTESLLSMVSLRNNVDEREGEREKKEQKEKKTGKLMKTSR